MVALDDALLTEVHALMEKTYPNLKFIKVGVNLGQPGCMVPILKACQGIKPNLIFNNAGYIMTGMFADSKIEAQMSNFNCNATCAVEITHHFAAQMKNDKTKGLIAFTSSPAGMMPCPLTSMYGATKAFVTEFATSIAPELYPEGIAANISILFLLFATFCLFVCLFSVRRLAAFEWKTQP